MIVMMIKNMIKTRYNKISNLFLASYRRKKINNVDFSIISNNCWGGYVYRFFGLPYLTPTVGLYINPKDYFRFLSDIKGYLNKKLVFIKPEDSRYYSELKKKGELNVPIGVIGDVEIVFLHYKTEQEAFDKWNRRAARVNYNNLIVKFSQMNNAVLSDLEMFDRLQFKKKFMFVNNKALASKYRTAIYFRGQEKLPELQSDTPFFDSYINLYELINSKQYPDQVTENSGDCNA